MANAGALLMPVGLLVLSNVFMTFAWYGHLKFKHLPLVTVVLASWGIAFFEYCLQVPANRVGHGLFTAAQLKILQEAITIGVFLVFAWLYLGERVRWNELLAFGLIIAAVVVATLPEAR
ncbi:MAG: DMT family protein [Candidatus Rokubacteria bacterium]|nr:DMT family protein [Candidatus Rokubacteria bacterium]